VAAQSSLRDFDGDPGVTEAANWHWIHWSNTAVAVQVGGASAAGKPAIAIPEYLSPQATPSKTVTTLALSHQ